MTIDGSPVFGERQVEIYPLGDFGCFTPNSKQPKSPNEVFFHLPLAELNFHFLSGVISTLARGFICSRTASFSLAS